MGDRGEKKDKGKVQQQEWKDKMSKVESYKTFHDGQIIFEDGSNSDGIYLVKQGEVEISKNVGDQKIVIEIIREGDIFGEMALIDKSPRSATAAAKGTAVVGVLNRDFFDSEFNKVSADFQKIIKTVAFRLRITTERYIEAQKGKGD